MRRLLVAAALAAAALATPAAANPVVDTCGSDDYTVARIEAADVEVAHLCTSEDPKVTLRRLLESEGPCLPCLLQS